MAAGELARLRQPTWPTRSRGGWPPTAIRPTAAWSPSRRTCATRARPASSPWRSTATTSRSLRERFVAEYFKTYGYRDTTPIELMKLRAIGRGLRENRLDFANMKIAPRPGGSGATSRAVSFARGEPAVAVADRRSRRARERSPARTSDRRGVRRHRRRAAGRHRPSRRDRLHRRGDSPHEDRSDHLRGHQERLRFDRRRDGLHGRAHRPLGNRQGRHGFLGCLVRRRRPDGGAGQDHRPASRRHSRSHGSRCSAPSPTTCTTATWSS